MFSVHLGGRPGDGYVVVELHRELDLAVAAAVVATVAAGEPDIIVDLAAPVPPGPQAGQAEA